jgi:beta-phosphoglucomutase-like phosphatase (HAD superfamily)
MVEAVLSDIDGTIVESNWLHAAAWRDAFAVIDTPLDIETYANRSAKAATSSSPSSSPGGNAPWSRSPSKPTAASRPTTPS